jgi:hypothetical protein
LKRAGGAVLLVLLLLLATQKVQAGVGLEMLWACHVASAMLALGLLFDLPVLIATGFLFHVAVGIPAYLLHLATGGDISAVSFLLHLLSPLFGWLAWRRQALPAVVPWLVLGTFLGLMAACRFATPESLNVNLAFHPLGPLAALGMWLGSGLNIALMAAQLGAARMLWNRSIG